MSEIEKYQLQQRWEISSCPSGGESCWCRGIIIEGTSDRLDEEDENGTGINYVVGYAELSETIAEHFVKLHNSYIDNLNSNKVPTPYPIASGGISVEHGTSVTYKLTKGEDVNKSLIEVNDFKLEDFRFYESEIDDSYAYILTKDKWEYEFNTEDGINFYLIINRVWDDGYLHKEAEYELKDVSINDCVKFINDYKNNVNSPEFLAYKKAREFGGHRGNDVISQLKQPTASEQIRENFNRIKENFDINDFEKWLIEYRKSQGEKTSE